MLAGGAPLHGERLAARGGPTDALADPRFFYDSSSYGARTIDALVRCVGDRPARLRLRPAGRRLAGGPSPLGPAAGEVMVARNVARLLRPAASTAAAAVAA